MMGLRQCKRGLYLLLASFLAGCVSVRPWEKAESTHLYEDERVVIFSTPSNHFFPLLFDGGSLSTQPVSLPDTFFDRLSLIQSDYYLGEIDFSFVINFPMTWRAAMNNGLQSRGNVTLYFKKRLQGHYSFTIYAPYKAEQLGLMRHVNEQLEHEVTSHDDFATARYVEMGYLHPSKGYVLPYGVVALLKGESTTFFWDNRPQVGKHH